MYRNINNEIWRNTNEPIWKRIGVLTALKILVNTVGSKLKKASNAGNTLAYYVSGNVLEPIGRDYLYSELVNPIFTKDGDNVKVKVAVKFLDNQTKATQVSQYELVLHKDSNWKIVG